MYVKFKRKANFCNLCCKTQWYECKSAKIYGGEHFEIEVQDTLVREQHKFLRKSTVFKTFFRVFSAENSQRVVLRTLYQVISLSAPA